MKRPEEVTLSREEGEALLARLDANALTAEDRRVLGKVLTFHFWPKPDGRRMGHSGGLQ